MSDFTNTAFEWRRFLHTRPELGFEEHQTAEFISLRLREFGLDVHTGIAQTGVVGVLATGKEGPSISLRADMDALPIQEENTFDHVSRNQGKMHACGHDGHTAMLLEAARRLALAPPSCGTVNFIFQPAEEGRGGGAAMVADGLFDRFPADAVFALHNWPGLPPGTIAGRQGPMLAALDFFDILVKGNGGHAAMPHNQDDVISATAALVNSLNTIISRDVDPLDSAVVSVTAIHAGEAYNVLPSEGLLKGTVRTFTAEAHQKISVRMQEICDGIALAMGVSITLDLKKIYPATVNSQPEYEFAIGVAEEIFGAVNVRRDYSKQLGSEDFAFMLENKPGCYLLIGNGSTGPSNCMLHSPTYDFNDDIIEPGATFWVSLAHRWMGQDKRQQ